MLGKFWKYIPPTQGRKVMCRFFEKDSTKGEPGFGKSAKTGRELAQFITL